MMDPFTGTVFVFRNRRRTAIKLLVYDGQGFWLCHKRLSKEHFRWWPAAGAGATQGLQAHELQVLLCAGDPSATHAQLLLIVASGLFPIAGPNLLLLGT